MKKTILTLVLFCCGFIGFAQEPVEVVVTMKAQYDRIQLCRQADFYPTKAARRDYVVNELKAFTKASQQDLMVTLNALEQQGLVSSIHSLWSANAVHFTTKEEVVLALAERPDIESISPVKQYLCIPEEGMKQEYQPLYDYIAPNITKVQANQVWELGFTGQGVVIAILDSGVNYNHMDLVDHLWDGGEEFPNHGYDIVNNDDDPMDDTGHGTHCAGTICGDGTAGIITGMAPDATLMCVKCVDSNGYTTAPDLVRSMEWAVEHGCDAMSLSLGLAKAEPSVKELLRHTCESILDVGIIAVTAVGNEGKYQHLYPIPNNVRTPGNCPPPYLDPDQMENPGGLTCVLAVGAVNANDTAADFTSQGPVTWQDTELLDYPLDTLTNEIGLIRPDVCAPGVDIWSLTYNHNNDYNIMSGTSQATPCVAGIVALLLSINPDLSPAVICQILEETSVKLTPTKSNLTGIGRVDALAAANAVLVWDAVNEALDINHEETDASDAFFQVIDMNGRIVLTQKGTNFSSATKNLTPGLYVLRMISNNQVKTQKIVIR